MNRPDDEHLARPDAPDDWKNDRIIGRKIGRKVVLCGLNARYIHTNLALRSLISHAVYVGAARTEEGASSAETVKMADVPTLILREWSINDQLLPVLARLARENADCYAFSCYIWNIEFVRRICRGLRKVRPQALIIWGGPEVSHQAAYLLQPNREEPVDLILCGEGELAFVSLLAALQDRPANRLPELERSRLSSVPNLCWVDRSDGEVRRNPPARLLKGAEWPFVYSAQDLAVDAGRILYYESSRGCPFACSYCLSSLDRKVRFRPLDLVFRELDQFLAANVLQVKFVDRTFNCNPERARSIWHHLIDQSVRTGSRTNFHFEVAGDLLDDASVDLLLSAPRGLFQLEIGVQTIQPAVLRAINRVSQPDIIARQVQRLRDGDNIHLHLDLIAGLPGESIEGVAATFNWIAALQPHHLQLGFLKILSGAPITRQAQALNYTWLDEPPYEVLSSDQLSFDDLCRLKRIEAVSELFRNSGFFPYALPWLSSRWPSPFAFFDELAEWMDQQSLLDRAINRDERSRLLHRFGRDRCPDLAGDDWLAGAWLDLVRLDYLGGGQKDLPGWMNFWENTTDPESRADLQQARRLYRQRHPDSTRFRLDRLTFDWEALSHSHELVPSSWLVGFEWSGAATRMTECQPWPLQHCHG